MKLRKELTVMVILIIVIVFAATVLPSYPGFVINYDRFIFYPFQQARNFLLAYIPFSVGDILYISGGIWALATIIRWVGYLVHFRSKKGPLARSILRSVSTILCFYLLFIAGWGANYNKQPVSVSWHLRNGAPKKRDTAQLKAFDQFLIDKINTSQKGYHALSFNETNKRAQNYYALYTDCHVKKGVDIKLSLFSYFMDRLGVDGYYNPFTGEGQVVSDLPDFIMPFVVCHEMAHQAGIAVEEDANLISYALCTDSYDSTFAYSAYLNIWLYTNTRLFYHDSALANRMEAQLNPLTRLHLDTLEEFSKKYHNDAARYSNEMYDSYLKMQRQKEGMHSYGNVSYSAWLLELQRQQSGYSQIMIP
jgi:hypothetical protein